MPDVPGDVHGEFQEALNKDIAAWLAGIREHISSLPGDE